MHLPTLLFFLILHIFKNNLAMNKYYKNKMDVVVSKYDFYTTVSNID